MDMFVFLMVVLASFFFGIRSANDSWIRKASKDQRIECRGNLYRVQEEK